MKPVIPDYDWIIFGVRVNHAEILFLDGAGFWVRARGLNATENVFNVQK